MKQAFRKGPRRMVVDDVPAPYLSPHHVLIQPAFSLISSGTEGAALHPGGLLKTLAEDPSHIRKLWNAVKVAGPVRAGAEVLAKFSEYSVLGYSGAGFVVDKHSTVADLDVGTRVAYGGEGSGHAEYVAAARHFVANVPDSVPFRHGCFTTIGSIALNAVRIAEIGIGDVVAVLGMGLVGQLIGQLVRLQGGIVIAADLRSERLDLARHLGAHHTALAGKTLTETVTAVTAGRGVDRVILAAASRSAAPCLQAVEIARDRGRVVVVGAVELSFPWQAMYRKEIQVLMARAYGPGTYDPRYEMQGEDYPIAYIRWTGHRNMEEFLRLVASGQVQLHPLITHEYPLEAAAQAYETILNPTLHSMAVVLRYADIPAGLEVQRRVNVSPHSNRAHEKTGRLRIGIVGAGNLARWVHLPNLKRFRNATLRTVCSTNTGRAKSYALRFGAEYCCSDYDELLKDPDTDVVLITSRHQHHASQALAALRAGKHVFVEKPMALTVEECRALCHAVEDTGKHLTVGFNRRFAPLYLAQKQFLARRRGPAVLNCRVSSPGISGDYWMADPSIGGAILGEACHFVDLMYWLLDAEPIAVTAYSLPIRSNEPIGQNNIVASFRFDDGSIGNLTYCTIGGGTAGHERVEAFAPGLRATVEDFKRLTLYPNRRLGRSAWFPDKGYAAQLGSFLERVSSGEAPLVTVRDGARATMVCLELLEATRKVESREVTIDWPAALS